MLVSNLVRFVFPYEPEPRAGQKTVLALPRTADGTTPEKVRIALRDTRPDGGGVPILLLHRAGVAGESLAAVAEKLAAQNFRVITPDLPGAGASQRKVDDYAVEASARTILAALDEIGVREVNIVGFGEGGAVALNMAGIAPKRVSSLALVSSVGAQEFELLGNHLVNKIVYTFHLAFIHIGETVLPHFGLLDRSPVNSAYARVFWDSDLTGNKKLLSGLRGAPLFVAHGEDDWTVAADTARYSAQVANVTADRQLFVAGGHKVFESGAGAEQLAEFLGKNYRSLIANNALSGAQVSATSASAEVPPPPPATGARLWVLMLIIIVCAFVAEDPTCLASGLLVAQGVMSFTAATCACLVSILIGDFTLYLIGYVLGRPALRVPPLRWIVPEYKIDRMAGWFEKKGFQGLLLIVTSRFIPASRLPTFVSAGIMRLSLWRLGILFFIAAALWTPPLVWIAAELSDRIGGDAMFERVEVLKHNAMWVAIGVLFGAWFLMHAVVPAVTWRGRRMLVMKMRRWTRHEYWPAWLLYAPVTFYKALCALKRLRVGVLATANPGLGWLGGCTGEAKSETLTRFTPAANAAPLAAWTLVPAGGKRGLSLEKRVEIVTRFLLENNADFPIALKPDIGDNGIGVNKICNKEQLAEWLSQFTDDALAQRWIAGEEYEVLWCRKPNDQRGRVLAVVEKRPPSVTGDGRRTLEELIWNDDRAVARANLYLRLNWQRASDIIPAGKIIALSPIGVHAYGVQAIDRQDLRTEALALALDAAATAIGGNLHCVVYDLRVPSAAALRDGKDWTITGISGADTISSRIRDQYTRLGYALASTSRQLQIAFTAADAARAQGAPSAPFLGMLAARAEARSRRMIDLRN
ncbi:MAG: alpha/beta fold hydrolase [Puniceicoccales bacterium]|nr:alpha/beta fold hydrolase [Puniceicoccales bacterium]